MSGLRRTGARLLDGAGGPKLVVDTRSIRGEPVPVGDGSREADIPNASERP